LHIVKQEGCKQQNFDFFRLPPVDFVECGSEVLRIFRLFVALSILMGVEVEIADY